MDKRVKTIEDFLNEKGGVEGVDYIIDDRYFCGECGSHTHRCDIRTGFCYECDGDNWSPEPWYRDELLCEMAGM